MVKHEFGKLEAESGKADSYRAHGEKEISESYRTLHSLGKKRRKPTSPRAEKNRVHIMFPSNEHGIGMR